jgi:putative nucleotidyltransferase with HDIG domain
MAVSSSPEDKVVKGIDLVETAEEVLDKVKEQGGNNVYSMLDIKSSPRSSRRDSKANEQVRVLEERVDKLNRKAKQSLIEAVFAFAKTIEVKDHYTAEHTERTVKYATEIAKAIKLPKEDIERIKQAAMLHDLGKIGISEEILNKKGPLTKGEMREIKKHPQLGADILRPIQFLHPIIPLILHHHERWDGKGYPSGLKGDEIPVGARVVALADVYHALTTDRPYRKGYSWEQAIEIIKKGSGSQFDPEVVDAFLKIIKQIK